MSSGFLPEKFLQQVPEVWGEIYQILEQNSFLPTLVGGSVRDFLLQEKLGHDWDLELTHPSAAFTKDAWKKLGHSFSKLGKVSYLSYEIIRLEIKSYQFEFSPPRREIFVSHLEHAGHSNFVAEFDFKLPFEKAVLRRDFTMNTLGVRFHSLKRVELLDPLSGVLHLREKILCPAGEDFNKDPVRFLRALRFSQKLHLTLAPELRARLEVMPLQGLSASYLWTEMQKSLGPLEFLKTLNHWKLLRPELKLPLSLEPGSSKWQELKKILLDPSKHESWMVALEWVGIRSDSWQSFFSLGAESGRRLVRWAQFSLKFSSILPETFQGEFEEIRERPEFLTLFDWYFTTKQILQKHPDLPLLKMIEDFLPAWIHLFRFEALKDVKHIDPPLRAKYQVWNLCQRL